MTEKSNGVIHTSHRARMRQKCLEHDTASFADHELVEMMLYYTMPRGDTNELAHKLIESYGSISGLMEATPAELMMHKGVGEQTSSFFALLREMMRRYAKDLYGQWDCYDTVSKIGQYIWTYFIGLNCERLYAMFFNGKMNMLDCVLLSEGTAQEANICIRKIAELAFQKRAVAVVLAHNHPHGLACPSPQDEVISVQLREALQMVGVKLLDHLVVTETNFYPIMKTRNAMPSVMSPLYANVGGTKPLDYEHFYDVDEATYQFPNIFDQKEN
ncbi:MAG: hypothetical protein IJX13_08740 [Clostridia bacterium]|nr:hypothetical protein [Clostridia bacterium]